MACATHLAINMQNVPSPRSQFSWGHFKKCQKSMRVWQPTPIGPSTRPDRLFRTHPQDRCGYGMHGIDADGDGVGQHAGEGF